MNIFSSLHSISLKLFLVARYGHVQRISALSHSISSSSCFATATLIMKNNSTESNTNLFRTHHDATIAPRAQLGIFDGSGLILKSRQ